MIRRSNRGFVLFRTTAIAPLLLLASIVSTALAASAGAVNDACALLTPVEVVKATGIKVGNGVSAKPIPGVLSRCTWTSEGDSRVIVTLGDAQHIGLTIRAAEQSGGQSVPGVGTKVVGIKGAALTGGYIVNVLDAKGGFGVSILGKEGTRDRAIALAKTVESHR